MPQVSQNQTQTWSVRLTVEKDTITSEEHAVFTAAIEGVAPRDLLFRYHWMADGGGLGGTTQPTLNQYDFGFIPPCAGRFMVCVEVIAGKEEPGHVNQNSRSACAWVRVEDSQLGALARPTNVAPDANTVIEVSDVSMIFNIASEQFNSLKEYLIAFSRHELNFKEFRALNHVDFSIKKGEAFGLVGTNGSGKSTMLKIIAGVLEPSEGSCTVKGTIAPLIELGAGFDMELTAKENIYLNGSLLGYKKEFIDAHFDEIVEFAELQNFMDMPLKNYSSGMVARIAFAVATITEPDILIVDETLSVGDFLFQQKCERRIQELVAADNVTVLFVSHSIDMVRRLCNRACWIEKGQLRMVGECDEVCDAYEKLGSA